MSSHRIKRFSCSFDFKNRNGSISSKPIILPVFSSNKHSVSAKNPYFCPCFTSINSFSASSDNSTHSPPFFIKSVLYRTICNRGDFAPSIQETKKTKRFRISSSIPFYCCSLGPIIAIAGSAFKINSINSSTCSIEIASIFANTSSTER